MIWIVRGGEVLGFGLVVAAIAVDRLIEHPMERRHREGRATRADLHRLLRFVGYKRRWHRDELVAHNFPADE